MARFRLVNVSTEEGGMEEVHFLDPKNDEEVGDFCSVYQTVDFDEIIEADLPDVFPKGHPLLRNG